MKKSLSFLSLFVLILVSVCSMSSCWLTDLHYEGLDVCGRRASVDIDTHIPFEMVEKFQYIDGNYYFYSRVPVYSKVLLYLSYNEQEYQNAKSYVISSKLQIDDSDLFESYNSYVFYIVREEYPSYYTLVGFSDTYNTIVFLGLYTNEYDYTSLSDTSFPQHISEHFGEWFDFE